MEYINYFDIDPEYFPVVNNDLMRRDPLLWKKFYPHRTFVELLKNTINVLERKQKLNIWVEGAYGTGKSHAVLTLKHLLEAPNNDIEQYFKEFNLDNDLMLRLNSVKSSGPIVTVHRYGSSNIRNDSDLFVAMQESIKNALKIAGINNSKQPGLRDGIIKYLSDEDNKRSFEVFVKGSYKDLFGGSSVEEILDRLKTYREGPELTELMGKIDQVARERRITAFIINSEIMKNWIREIISTNHLKALVFIWDEFSEYFKNNRNNLTGFQEILELSETEPFCFIPVTHSSDALLTMEDKERKKIRDRFINPSCIIELPDNMAFKLMGQAIRKTADITLSAEWEDILSTLQQRTTESRKQVAVHAGIQDNELLNILPIHPYTAVMLKHIAASFGSNQRSMFNFIKNDDNENQHGFIWYINNHDWEDGNPFLTIDMLWDFFYENGKQELERNICQILERYSAVKNQLDKSQQTVLKAVLLLQAMSLNTGNSVEIFLPNQQNIDLAYEGTDLDNGSSSQCAEGLVEKRILSKQRIDNEHYMFNILTEEADPQQIKEYIENNSKKATIDIVRTANKKDIISLSACLRNRFIVKYVGMTDLERVTNEFITSAENDLQHFYVVAAFAKDNEESDIIAAKFKNKLREKPSCDVIFVNCLTTWGIDKFNNWVEDSAYSQYYANKNRGESERRNNSSLDNLNEWLAGVADGRFCLYTKTNPDGENINDQNSLNDKFVTIDRSRFPLSIECNYPGIDNWWTSSNLSQGVGVGASKELSGTYRSSNIRLNEILADAWNVEQYWDINHALPISRIKSALEQHIQSKLSQNGRISISDIYEFLKDRPYGFLPCNFTAFFIGFLLKEYVDNNYYWTDNITTVTLTMDKLKNMVGTVINNDLIPTRNYKDSYIVTKTRQEKAFLDCTSTIFNINSQTCTSTENTRNFVCNKIRDYYFPLWSLKEILDEFELSTDRQTIENLIDKYVLFVGEDSQHPTNVSNEIGEIFLQSQNAKEDLHNILSSENCKKGMLKYLKNYRDGFLPQIAEEVNDNGQYINCLKDHNTDESNWLWNKETYNEQIDDVILEYEIIKETNRLLGQCNNYKRALSAWIDSTSNIRLAYKKIEDNVEGTKPLLSILYEIKKDIKYLDNRKQDFFDSIRNHGTDYLRWLQNQLPLFKQKFDFLLTDLSDDNKEIIFKKVPGCFTQSIAEYESTVSEIVRDYKDGLGIEEIRTIWKTNTNTTTPDDWCNTHKMPIIIMVADEDYMECKELFDILNSSHFNAENTKKAKNLLRDFKYWDKLRSEEARNKAFKNKILGDKQIILDNIDEVKNTLRSRISVRPYDWNGNPIVKKTIQDMASSKYSENGYRQAIAKIENMDVDKIKSYLKELIENNMEVGIQIIKNN